MSNMMFVILAVAMLGFMWWQSRKMKKQQAQLRDFRESLEAGTEVITIGGIIGKVVSVDTKFEEIVLESEGSPLRVSFAAVNRVYERPAYVDDADVDEQGNPLPKETTETAETAENRPAAQLDSAHEPVSDSIEKTDAVEASEHASEEASQEA